VASGNGTDGTAPVPLLLKNPHVNVNQAQREGITPLQAACLAGNIVTVKWFIASGRVDPRTVVPTGEEAQVIELLERYTKNPVETRKLILAELGASEGDEIS